MITSLISKQYEYEEIIMLIGVEPSNVDEDLIKCLGLYELANRKRKVNAVI